MEFLMRFWLHVYTVCFLTVLSGCDPKSGQKPEPIDLTPKEAEVLTPADMGVGKYVFEAKVPATKVMVLRQSKQENQGKSKPVQETIRFTGGGVAREEVLVFDVAEFPFAENWPASVRIRAQGISSPFKECRCTRTSLGPGRLGLTLTHPDGVIVITYECLLEDYDVAKKRVPKLPDAKPNEKWSFANPLGEE